MIAFRIRINGELVATIGQEDMSILTTNLVASRGNQERDVNDYIRLNLGGLSHELAEGYCQHFRWADREMSLGDRIEIEVFETDSVNPPLKRYRSDKAVQENPYTDEEVREMRYADYLELKKQFDHDDDA